MSKPTDIEAMASLFEELTEDFLMLSDEEVLTEATEDCEDISVTLKNIRAQVATAINSLAKDRLSETRAALEEARQASAGRRVSAATRSKLAEMLSARTSKPKMTLAARNGNNSSDSDILADFSDLCELHECSHKVPIPNFGNASKAEYILRHLGITEPNEIDIEVIAWRLGARVKYARIDYCEARIIGADDAAIITVDKKSSRQRQRFSIGHELGHWIYHRNKTLLCAAEEIERPSAGSSNSERVADRFASELLMPAYLFCPLAEKLGRATIQAVRKLSELFETSQTATAIRLVETSNLPLMLVCSGKTGRRWFARSQTVSSRWMPNSELSPESVAFNMIFRPTPQTMPPKSVSAAVWFNHWDAHRFELIEESTRIASDEILTLLSFRDAQSFLRLTE
jgi:hypothetical protein